MKAQSPVTADFLLLRFLVGFLGEKGQGGWWDTGFLSSTGLRYSQVNFPRSALAAAGTSVTEAAKRLHDSRIGKGGVFHLFRLPPAIEEAVHREMMQMDVEAVKAQIANRDSALHGLRELASETINAPEGPVQVGSVKTILRAGSVEEIAKHYLDAFLNAKMTFPYFMDKAK